MRNVGGSVGIAMVSTYLVRRSQTHQTMLVQHLTPENPLLRQTTSALQHYIRMHQGNSGTTASHALAMLYRLLQQQSYLLAFYDLYSGLAVLALISTALVLLFRKVKLDGKVAMH
jgi:MFS transporter, DHA2 family, multidrug resistance protein